MKNHIITLIETMLVSFNRLIFSDYVLTILCHNFVTAEKGILPGWWKADK